MKASDLRIWNFVEVRCNCDCHKSGEIIMHFAPCCDKPVDVISILGVVENPNLTGVGVLGKGRLHKIETVYPIPLTEDWRTPAAQVNNINAGEYYFMFHHLIHTIKYVHQLQNLYFALTGEELTIKES